MKQIKKISVILFGLLLFFCSLTFAQTPEKKVAVLPFNNLMKDASLDWLSSGISSTVTTKLGNVKGLYLVERSQIEKALSELKFQNSGFIDETSAKEVGKFLGVDVIVIGEFQKAGSTLRITARFVEVQTGKIASTADVTGNFDDIFKLQDDIAFSLLKSMGIDTSGVQTTSTSNTSKSNTTTTSQSASSETSTSASSVNALELYGKGYNEQFTNKNLDKAVDYYKQALDLDPNYGDALYYLSWALDDLEKYSEARKYLTKLLDLEPQAYDAYTEMCYSYYSEQNYADAEVNCKRAISIKEDYGDPHYYLGKIYYKQGKDAEAVKELKIYTDIKPDSQNGWYYLGYCYNNLEQYDNAIAAEKKVIEIEGDVYDAYAEMCYAYLGKKDYESAVTSCKKSISLKDNYASSHYYLGVSLYNLYKDDEAKAELKKAADLGSENAKKSLQEWFKEGTSTPTNNTNSYNTASGSAEDWYNKAYTEQFTNKNLNKAIEYYKNAISVDANYADAYYYIAVALDDQEKYSESRKYLTKLLDLQPQAHDGWTEMCYAYYSEENYSEAEYNCKKAISIKDDYYNAHFYLGRTYGKQGNASKAAEELKTATQLKPENSNAWYYLGFEYNNLENYDNAIAAEKKVIEIDGDVYDAYAEICYAYLGKKDYESAVTNCKKSISLKDNYASSHYYLGVSLYNLYKDDEAKVELKKAADLGSENAKKALNEWFK